MIEFYGFRFVLYEEVSRGWGGSQVRWPSTDYVIYEIFLRYSNRLLRLRRSARKNLHPSHDKKSYRQKPRPMLEDKVVAGRANENGAYTSWGADYPKKSSVERVLPNVRLM